MKKTTLVSMFSALLMLGAASSPAHSENVVIKLGTAAPQGSPWHLRLKEAAQQWKEKSGGTVELRYGPTTLQQAGLAAGAMLAVLGVFWKRANYLGAVLGMTAGLGTCAYYMFITYPFFGCGASCVANQWWDIAPISAGTFGIPAGFLGVIIGSLISPAPSKEIQELVDHVRYPSLEGDIDTKGA